MAGGASNPLGAPALYLGASAYPIHGTNQPSTIGWFVSSGCIRTDQWRPTGVIGPSPHHHQNRTPMSPLTLSALRIGATASPASRRESRIPDLAFPEVRGPILSEHSAAAGKIVPITRMHTVPVDGKTAIPSMLVSENRVQAFLLVCGCIFLSSALHLTCRLPMYVTRQSEFGLRRVLASRFSLELSNHLGGFGS
jgi:hypothetical protein